MLARAPPGQQKDGAVGAADDEQKDDPRQQKREGAAQVLLVRHDDGLQREMRVIGRSSDCCFLPSSTMGSSAALAPASVMCGRSLIHGR